MLTYCQHKVWASVSLYALAASLLIFSIPEISCETEAHNSIDDNSHHEIGDRFTRSIKATPLRWGKRSTDSQLYELYNKRAPLRWGKRAPSRFGKRAPMRFGKRAPMRFGKRDELEDVNELYEFLPAHNELNYPYDQ